MRNINYSSKKAVCSICVILALWPLGAHADVSLPDPDNAALLYYQAFLLRPELDDETFLHYNSVLNGAQPDEKVRDYLNKGETRETISIVEDATEILDCSWGIIRSQGLSRLIIVLGNLRQIALLLEVDARILVADGDYRAAFNRCLSIRRLAQHIANESVIGYLISQAAHVRAFLCIRHVLSSMPPDTNILTWLQGQLSGVQGTPQLPGKAMEISLDDALKLLRMNPELLADRRGNFSELIEDESARQEIMGLSDEEYLGRARESYNRFLGFVNRVIGSDMPYQQKRLELQGLKEELEDHAAAGDPVGILWFYMTNDVIDNYDIYVRCLAHYNATRTAIEIYLVQTETGQLPEILPAHSPKDPFSNQDFEYEVTRHGFTLRCREKDITLDLIWEYEFKVQSNGENN